MDSQAKWFGLSAAMIGFGVMLAALTGIVAEYTAYSGEFLAMSMLGLVITTASGVFLWLHASGVVDLCSKAWSRTVSS